MKNPSHHTFLRKIFTSLTSMLYLATPLLAQDAAFLQPYTIPLLLNPAYTGSDQHFRAGATYLYQQLPTASNMTCALFADYYFKELKSGIGISAIADVQGSGMLAQTSLGASYAFNLRIARQTFLRIGLHALADIFTTSAPRFVFPDQLDFGSNSVDASYVSEQHVNFDMALGGVFSHRNFFAGLAAHNLLGQPSGVIAGENLATPINITIHGGYNIRISNVYSQKVTYLSPNMLYTWQGQHHLISVGASFLHQAFSVSARYQKVIDGASTLIFGAAYSSHRFSLGYRFGYSMANSNATYSSNSHELFLLVKFKYSTLKTYQSFRTYEETFYIFPVF